jgi:hypothetical protein
VQSQADILEAVNKAIAGSEDVSEYCHPQNGMIDNYDLTLLIYEIILIMISFIYSFITFVHVLIDSFMSRLFVCN